MTNKKVRVFWPVDQQWYIANVQQYNTNTGEHLLRYPDGDTEWVRIGEDHTTNTQYKEYFRLHGNTTDGASTSAGTEGAGNLTRLPSLGGGVSFALSQSFGMPGLIGGETSQGLKGQPSQQQRLFQQLNLDRTASSMSSFGFGSPLKAGAPDVGGDDKDGVPPFQILDQNYTHSFSSKIGTTNSLEFGGPHLPPLPLDGNNAPHPYYHAGPPQDGEGRDGAPPMWQHAPPMNQQHFSSSNQHGHPMYGYPPPVEQVGGQKSSSTKASSSSKKASKKKDGSSSTPKKKEKKAIPKAWTKIEDEFLLDQVLQMKHPLKWSILSQTITDFNRERADEAGEESFAERSGKQCRERYVNHLNPRLKHSEFTPLEDMNIWRLYATIGTQWAKMSKVIPGRTDNNLKNRFHNLKRQLQREEDSRKRATQPEGYDELIHTDQIREVPEHLRTRIEDMWNHSHHIGLVAAHCVQDSRDERDSKNTDGETKKDGGIFGFGSVVAVDGRKFGPFVKVTEHMQCGRCGLFMPSVHCGTEMCTKTKWCRTCTKVSINLSGNVLRECLNLRKCQDKGLDADVEMLVAQVRDGM